MSEAATLVLRPKKAKTLSLLAISSMFVAIGIVVAVGAGDSLGFVCAAFFGIGVVVAVVQLIPNSSFLRIDSTGITIASMFRQTSVPWSVVDRFFVVSTKMHGLKVGEMVGFDFVPTYDRARLGRQVASALGACEGAIPDTYGKTGADLAALLNARLEAARTLTS